VLSVTSVVTKDCSPPSDADIRSTSSANLRSMASRDHKRSSRHLIHLDPNISKTADDAI